jgi:5-methylcytosine-specific restriction endonuclease McrA
MRAWVANNPEKAAVAKARTIAKQRIVRATNHEKFKAYEAARYAADPEHARSRAATYRAAHREETNATSAAWRAANPERQRAAKLRWEAAHPDKVRAWRAANYVAHREERRAYAAAEHAANPEKRRAYNREYNLTHRAQRATIENARRARKAGNGGSHTLQEWKEKLELFAYCCVYCGESKPLTVDHKIPLSRGGTDDIMNIVPACRNCNSKKRHRTTQEYLALRVA